MTASCLLVRTWKNTKIRDTKPEGEYNVSFFLQMLYLGPAHIPKGTPTNTRLQVFGFQCDRNKPALIRRIYHQMNVKLKKLLDIHR